MQFDLQVGVGTVVVAKPLDAELQSVYNMTVQVTDGTNFATAQVCSHSICYTLTHSCSTLTSNIIVPSSLESCIPSACILSMFTLLSS